MHHRHRIKPHLFVTLLSAALAAGSFTCAPVTPAAEAQNTEANVTRLTAGILARSQFAHNPLDRELAAEFLNRYLDTLDARRSLFLESDIRSFTTLEPDLARATVVAGDTKLAHVIWKRYLQRIDQQNQYLKGFLAKGEPSFQGQDSYELDRDNAERPKDLAAAKELWKQRARAEYLDEKLDGTPREKIVSDLQKQYDRQAKSLRTLEAHEVTGMYLDALASVYDPHSEYLGRDQMQSLEMAMNLSLFGIGASLEMRDGYCTVREVIPGSPASRSTLKPGDRIVAVAQADKPPVDVSSFPLSRTVELIRGPKGSRVRLTVLPASGSSTEIALVRDEIQLEDQEAKASIVDLESKGAPPLRLGVIDLPSFYAGMDSRGSGPKRSVTADVEKLLKKLKAENVRGVLLDLRLNGGGSLEEAIRLTGLFIPEGPIVLTQDADGDVDVEADTDKKAAYQGPLVVLTSRMSASASEILAGALQDYGRAVIVGDTATFGKGTVQSILPLAPIMKDGGLSFKDDPGALKVTIRKFYRPSGASTQLRGVGSDIVIPSTTDVSDISESALKNPLPWDTVRAAPFQPQQQVAPFLDALRKQSARRTAAEASFALVQQTLAEMQERLKSKRIPLNEAQRREQRAREETRQRELEAWWKAREQSGPKSYEVRLKQLTAPALPAPKPFAALDPTDLNQLARRDDGTPEPAAVAAAAASDIVLNEGVQILADYVRVSGARGTPKGPGWASVDR